MGDMRESFDLLKEYCKEKHDARVAKNPDRVAYAIEQFEKNEVEYTLKNASTGHFHCRRKCDDKLFQFWAGKGTIMADNKVYDARGIHALLKILCKEV